MDNTNVLEPAMETKRNVFSIKINADVETVWQEITTGQTVQEWYFGSLADFELKPGSPIYFRSKNRKHLFIKGAIQEVEAPYKFVYTFQFSDLKKEPPSRVTFELKKEMDQTRVTVLHDQIEQSPKTIKRATKGWPAILGNLKSFLERGKLPLKSRIQHGLMKLFMPLMPKE